MFFIKIYYFLNKPINNIKLTACDKMVYGIIDFAQKQGSGKWAVKTYADKINISQKQVQNSMAKLKKAKLITSRKGYFKITVKTGENKFIMLNSNVLNDKNLSANTKIIYSFIRQKVGKNAIRSKRIPIKDIYEFCGCSQKCAYNCIHKLVNNKYIITHSDKDKNTFYKIIKDLWKDAKITKEIQTEIKENSKENSKENFKKDLNLKGDLNLKTDPQNEIVICSSPSTEITLISNAF